MEMCFVALLFFLFNVGVETTFQKCNQITTYGYGYESLYKLPEKQGPVTVNFTVKASSDAHILFSIGTLPLESLSMSNKYQETIEVLIGGGRNTFSEIRSSPLGSSKKYSRAHVATPDILSAVEYRSFWITVFPSGKVQVGNSTNLSVPFLTGDASISSFITFIPHYFGISTWNHIKGHWKINCPEHNGTVEFDSIEETRLEGVPRLRRYLTYYYDPSVTPEPRYGQLTATVTLGMLIQHIDVNEHTSMYKITGKMHMEWHDNKLEWYPGEFDNITGIRLDPADIWTPDLVVMLNTVPNQDIINRPSAPVVVASDGTITWTPHFELNAFCQLEIENWPHDTHSCDFDIGLNHEILIIDTDHVGASLEAAPLGSWEVKTVNTEWKITKLMPTNPSITVFSNMIIVNLEIVRDNTSFTAVFSTPFFACALMVLSAMWLNPGVRAKLYISCCSVIVMTMFLIALADEMPVYTVGVPTIVSLYVWGMLLSAGSVIHYVVVSHMTECTWTFPHRFRKILTNPMVETCLCFTGISQENSSYANMEDDNNKHHGSNDWIITTKAYERILFIVLLFIYTILWLILNS